MGYTYLHDNGNITVAKALTSLSSSTVELRIEAVDADGNDANTTVTITVRAP